MKNETITIKLNKRKIKRNILIILFIILVIKYISFMNNYNKKVFAVYDDFVNYAQNLFCQYIYRIFFKKYLLLFYKVLYLT